MPGQTVAITPVPSDSLTPEFHSFDHPHQFAEFIGENLPVDDSVECATDLGLFIGMQRLFSLKNDHSRSPTARRSASPAADETEDRSELSYVTDRSTMSPSPDNSGMNGTTSRGCRSPYVTISSREHSLYQARKSGSDGNLARLSHAIDALRHLPSSDKQTPDPPTGQGVLVLEQPLDTQNESPAEGRGMGGLTETQHPLGVTTGMRPHGPLGEVHDTPSNVSGPHLSTNPHDRADIRNVATDATTPTHNSVREGAAPITDTRAPPVPPLPRVRVRGVFIIGDGAPIRIDEGIEVCLRDGVDGRVDFII